MQKQDPEMSSKIKEAVSVIVALALVAVMQYFAARDCCRPLTVPPQSHLQKYPQPE